MHVDINYLKDTLSSAGKILLHYFGRKQHSTPKSNRDILLQADLESEKYIVDKLVHMYSNVFILSEEDSSADQLKNPYRFVLDPLDGTINFSRSIQEFGISLAFQKKNKTVIGLVYKPITSTFYEACLGQGSLYHNKKIYVSKIRSLKDSIIAIDPAREENHFPSYSDVFHCRIRAFRSYGCAIQVLGYVAEGKIDAYIYNKPKIWDVAAMQLIIEEAGGYVLNHSGSDWEEGQPLLTCSPSLKKSLISLLDTSH